MVVNSIRLAIGILRRNILGFFLIPWFLGLAGGAHAALNSGFENSLTGWTTPVGEHAIVESPGDECTLYLAYENINCEPDGFIDVITGQKMLRLGSPKTSSEKQNQISLVTTSGPFTPTSASMDLAARLFSYEFRGDDQFIVEVIDKLTGAPHQSVTINLSFGEAGSCSANPCTVDIDIGRRSNKAPFDSGDTDIQITGLPTDTEVQVRFTLNPSNNEALPTWVYLDNRNSPPDPVIAFGPGNPALNFSSAGGTSNPAAAFEGDFVSANCFDSEDPEGDALTCNWKAWGGGLDASETNPVEQLDTKTAVFYFPDSEQTTDCVPPLEECTGHPTIVLEVSDGQAPPVVEIVKVNLRNAPPIVGAVDLEVLAGSKGVTVCRFADAGIGTYGFGDGVPGDGTQLTDPELGKSCVPELDPTCSVDNVVSMGSLNMGSLNIGSLSILEKRVEHVAEFASGFVLGEFDATGLQAGTDDFECVVADDVTSGSDMFQVTVLDNSTVNGREPPGGNETADQADGLQQGSCLIENTCAASGSNYLARLESPEDQDVFVVRNPDGAPFPPNSDVLVTLDVPADYELMILARLEDGFISAPFLSSPRISAPFFGSTFQSAPFFGSTFGQAPFFNTTFNQAPFFGSGFTQAEAVAAPFFSSTFQPAPFFSSTFSPASNPFYAGPSSNPYDLSFNQLPLSKTGLAVPDGDGISGKDIDLTDTGSLSTLGLQSEPNLQVVEISANTGADTEKIMFRTTGNVKEYYAVVFGSYGAFSAAPYSLRVESSEPPSQEELWGTNPNTNDYCAPDATFAATYAGGEVVYEGGEVVDGTPESTETLIITQKERFETVHPDAGFDDLVLSLTSLLGDAAVVSVDPSWYADADMYPCRVHTRNDLLQKIKNKFIVNSETNEFHFPGLKNIVILGDGSVIPPYARLDTTLVGYEGDYAYQVPTRTGSWTTTAVAEGYNSTYAFLADKEGILFEGDLLWIEDVPITVLVGDPGTPEVPGTLRLEIESTAPTGSHSVIAGVEAFADSAQINADLIGGNKDVLIDPDENPNPWSAQELRAIYDDGVSCTTRPQLAFINLQTHMTPRLLWSSKGYRDNDFTDVVSALEPKSCVNTGSATLSLGCHSGMEIPKLQVTPPEPGQPQDPAKYKDWVDEPGAMIAPIGYGLGDRFTADRVTEGLLTRTLQATMDPYAPRTLPEALMHAKHQYLLEVADFDAHDADALMVLTAYMMPNYRLDIPTAGSMLASLAETSLTSTWCPKLDTSASLALSLYQNGAPAGNPAPVYDCAAPPSFGEYNLLTPGGASGAYNRPLLPYTRGLEAVPVSNGQPFNDVLLVNRANPAPGCPDGFGGLTRECRIAATFEDFPGVDPVFSFPETNWSQPPDDLNADFAQQELDACLPNLGPFPLSYFTTAGDLQTQIIRGAQFRCDEALSTELPGDVRGTYRRFESLHLDALQANHQASVATEENANPVAVDQNPPQVTTLEFFADPITNQVEARIAATDEHTGDSQICEMSVLVFFDDIDGPGRGLVESYSTRYDTVPTYNPSPTSNDVVPENTVINFTLHQARGNRLAGQICDCDGNCVYKTFKGILLTALDVHIVELILLSGGFQIRVENYEQLKQEYPTLTLEVCYADPQLGCRTYLYDLTDLPYGGDPDNPPLPEPEINSDDGTATFTLTGVAGPGDTVTATVRSGSAFGSDSATLVACVDDIGDTEGFHDADIARCAIKPEGDGVAFDLLLNDAGVLNEDVKYRLDLINLGAQVQYFQGTDPDEPKNGKISGGPPGWKDVRALKDGDAVRGLSFVFTKRDLENMGWTGGALQVRFETQSGVPGEPNQGIPDQTIVFEYEP